MHQPPSSANFDPGVHLTKADISVDDRASPSKLFVQIKASKTDPFRGGVTVVLGATLQELCPITAILPFLTLRGAQEGLLFKYVNGSYLTRDHFVVEVRRLLEASGIESSRYSDHSFRIGAATTAARAGVESHVIQTLGQWHSSAYLLYIRLPRDSLASILSRLVSHRALTIACDS
jgi:hypothetical protein